MPIPMMICNVPTHLHTAVRMASVTDVISDANSRLQHADTDYRQVRALHTEKYAHLLDALALLRKTQLRTVQQLGLLATVMGKVKGVSRWHGLHSQRPLNRQDLTTFEELAQQATDYLAVVHQPHITTPITLVLFGKAARLGRTQSEKVDLIEFDEEAIVERLTLDSDTRRVIHSLDLVLRGKTAPSSASDSIQFEQTLNMAINGLNRGCKFADQLSALVVEIDQSLNRLYDRYMTGVQTLECLIDQDTEWEDLSVEQLDVVMQTVDLALTIVDILEQPLVVIESPDDLPEIQDVAIKACLMAANEQIEG